MRSLIDILERAALTEKGIFIVGREGDVEELLYRDLLQQSKEILFALNKEGLKAGDELIFQIEDCKDFILIFWAAVLGGIIPVPLMVGGSDEHRLKFANVWNILNNPYLITETSIFNRFKLGSNVKEFENVLCDIENRAILKEDLKTERADTGTIDQSYNEIAFIQFSSGSTGSPKGVVLTHDNLLTNIDSIVEGMDYRESDSTLSWMPLTHDMGLIGFHLTPVFSCMDQYIMPTSLFIRKPVIWMDIASKYRVSLLSSPNFGYKFFMDYLKRLDKPKWDLSHVRLIFNGAEPIDSDICNTFLDEMEIFGLKRNVMFCVYGLAEACLAVTFPPPEEEVVSYNIDRTSLEIGETVESIDDTDRAIKFVDLGYPVKNCEVRIFDTDGNCVPDGVVGRIYIRGKNVTRGYYNNIETTQNTINESGWLNTGDLGFFLNGRLVVSGREKDVLFVNGQNYYSHDIERVLYNINGIDLGRVVVTGVFDPKIKSEIICVFIAFRRSISDFADLALEAKALLNKNLGLSSTVVIPIRRIPKTTSGKVQRYKLGESYLQGLYNKQISDLEELYNSSNILHKAETETEKSVLAIWTELLKKEDISIEDDFFELGGDSLKGALLIGQLLDNFSVELSIDNLFDATTIRKLSALIDSNKKIKVERIKPAKLQEFYTLSKVQRRMYLIQQRNPENLGYNLPYFMEIEGALDVDKLRNAFDQIVKRHEILRTNFKINSGEPVQFISDTKVSDFNYIENDSFNKDKYILDFIRPFNLETDSLLRIEIIKIESNNYFMLFDMHHIISDGTTMGLIIKEFTSLYSGLDLKPVKLHYKDYASWENTQNDNPKKSLSKNYWQKEFEDEIPLLDLPTNYKRPTDETYEGSCVTFHINNLDINKLTGSAGTTPFMFFLSAFYILLSKYSGQDDIVIGSPIAGREKYELKNVMGMFVSSLPLRNKPEPDMQYRDFLQNVKAKSIKAFNNLSYQFDNLIEDLDVHIENGRHPLFDVMFSYQNMEIEEISLDGLNFKPYPFHPGNSKFDLTMTISENQGNFKIEVEYKKSLFSDSFISGLSTHFTQIIDSVIQNPEIKIGDINIVSSNEKKQIVDTFSTAVSDYPSDKTLSEIFEEIVNRHPDNIALAFGDMSLTYSDLNCRINKVAHNLRKKGVKSGSVVGLLSERSIDMIICIWAIIKAGGCYLPIDSANPSDRISHMLSDTDSLFLICESNLCNLLNKDESKVITIEDLIKDSSLEQTVNPEKINTSKDLAYIMYTSGSTGKPKGIKTSHFNITRVVNSTNYIDIVQSDVMLQLSNYAFDGSTFDIFGSLLNGAKLILVPKELALDMTGLSSLIVDQKVTLFFITTALFNTLADTCLDKLTTVRKILFGGERVSVKHVEKALDVIGQEKLIHVYGPTESTVFATYYHINNIDNTLETIPIGKPVANTKIFVFNQNNNLQPIGIPGELCISGDGLASGYLNRDDLTSEKFVNNPLTNEIMYRTGDLVKWLPDGNIEFLGRIDKQVKLRGFRLELNEIENAILNMDGIQKVHVNVFERDSNTKNLCAYYQSDREYKFKDFKSELKKKLPVFMIPEYFISLDKLPVNRNGKVDTRKLPGIDKALLNSEDLEAPETELQELLANIWMDVLVIEKVGINQNFSELGGHSLKAATIISRIYKELNKTISLNDFYNNQTIKSLANCIKDSESKEYIPIVESETREFYPLALQQNGLYFQEQFDGIGTSYNMPVVLELNGPFNEDLAEKSIKKLVSRYEALRTGFYLLNETPVMKVLEDFFWELEDLTDSGRSEQDIINSFIRPFDLTEPPLLRAGYININDKKNIMIFDIHHIISDGVALVKLLEEFTDLYNGISLSEIKLNYRDYVLWQQSYLESHDCKDSENYWSKTLADNIPALDIPTDYSRKKIRTFSGNSCKFNIPAGNVFNLTEIAANSGSSMNSLLLTIYSVLLNRYSRQKEFYIGTLVSGRSHPDTEYIFGMFNNFLPLKFHIDSDFSLIDYLNSNNTNIFEAFEHQDYPYSLMVEKFNDNSDLARNTFFDTMLIYHNQLENSLNLELNDIELKLLEFNSKTSKLDFKLDIYSNSDGSFDCAIEYNTSLFKEETIKQMSNHFIKIVECVIENPQCRIGDIDILSDSERLSILSDFNNTKASFPDNVTIPELFKRQVELRGDETAVYFRDETLSYNKLDSLTNSLARTLRDNGSGQDKIVAVMLERSLYMPTALIGILKSGGAYLPIDPSYPAERINFILNDSGAKLLVTDPESLEKLDGKLSIGSEKIVLLSEDVLSSDQSDLDIDYRAEDLAYVIYTSGSTGKPKGAMIEHKALVNRLNWMQKNYPICTSDVILQKTPYTFDVSVWEQFWWAIDGASVCFLEPEGEKDPEIIKRAIANYKITTMHFVPSMLSLFLDSIKESDIERLSSLKQVFSSGEALLPAQVNKFNNLLSCNSAQLFNLYGPTEATIDVSYFNCSDKESYDLIPIGKPIDNTHLYIVDKDDNLCPVGVPGELCIAGAGLARGYLNRPNLTKEKFVENPFLSEIDCESYTKMYRTGDLTKWMSNGDIEYLGRIDFQVKIRGNRIELGEIEAELAKFDGITETVVVARNSDDDKYLCAYYTGDSEPTVNELRSFLSKSLTDYMIPSYFVKLDKIPLSANGKIDRKQLPEPDSVKVNLGNEYRAPETETEKKLVAIWEELLNRDEVGIDDNFFDLGGHSLSASMLAVRITRSMEKNITLSDIFRYQDISNLAKYMDSSTSITQSDITVVEKRDYYPLSSAQKRLFILDKIDEKNTVYNLPGALCIRGKVDIEKLDLAFQTLISRHESFRTNFATIDEEPVQFIRDDINFKIEVEEHDSKDIYKVVHSFIKPFDLEHEALIRIKLINVEENYHILFFDMHHIISDGYSSMILIKELVSLYSGNSLKELKYSYKDFSNWHNRQFKDGYFKTDEKFWIENLGDDLPVLDLPTNFKRPAIQSFSGDKYSIQIPEHIFEGINDILNGTDNTLYMLFLTAYNVLLHKYSRQEDMIVGSPTVGRRHSNLESIIGMFVNTVAIRNRPNSNKRFNELLEEVKKSSLEALEHQDYPFEQLVDRLQIKKDLSRNPIFDTMFVLQNIDPVELRLDGLKIEPFEINNKVSKFDLTFEVIENDRKLNIEYNTSLFKEETINQMSNHFIKIIECVIENPQCKIGDIDILSDSERVSILSDFNNTKASFPDNVTIPELFKKQVELRGDETAVYFRDETLSYNKLDSLTNSLARTLRENGSGQDEIVAVMLERSLYMPTALIGILKSGGAYLPIDPSYPAERINFILNDSGAKLLVTDPESLEKLDGKLSISPEKVVLLSEDVLNSDQSDLDIDYRAEDLAYVIYTSGSTGKPKGAMIEHKALVNRLNWMQKTYPICTSDVILQKTPYTFDVSVWEQFWWAIDGASVCFLEPEGEKDPEIIKRAIANYKITTMHFVPSMLSLFLDSIKESDIERLSSLKQVFSSGEALLPAQVNKFNNLLSCNSTQLFNLYGPTEATIDVSYFNCSDKESYDLIPIGKPIDNTHLYIVDKDDNLCPVGVPGELCIAGVGLARGYLNRPNLTKEKFLENPFLSEIDCESYTKMYRTGDLTKWMSNGDIEYLGRIDFQVKIRGNRIELGEIEAELVKFDGITETVVVARNSDDDKYLCAYYTGDSDPTVNELRSFLSKSLTDYMIPSYFVKLDKIPLSANGKIDRKQLPEPDSVKVNLGNEYRAPETETEKKLVAIWEELLNRDEVGIDDNFFDLGGTSLMIISMQSRVLKELNFEIKITELFSSPTIHNLGKMVDGSTNLFNPGRTILPQEYFVIEDSQTNTSNSFSYDFEYDVLDYLKGIEGCNHFSGVEIVSALFAHLLSQNTDSNPLQVNYLSEGFISVLDIDIDDFETVGDLVKGISNMISLSKKPASILEKSSNIRNKNEAKILINSCSYSGSELFDDIFDLVITIHNRENYTGFTIDFDKKRLNHFMVRKLFEDFISLIDLALDNISIAER